MAFHLFGKEGNGDDRSGFGAEDVFVEAHALRFLLEESEFFWGKAFLGAGDEEKGRRGMIEWIAGWIAEEDFREGEELVE